MNFKFWLLSLFFIAACATEAKDNNHAVGTHGMVIFKVGDKVLASHMPLHDSIHAHQIVFELQISNRDLRQIESLFAKSELVSVMPEIFDLHDLISGNLSRFTADIYTGHFERGGKNILPKVNIGVRKVLLARNIKDVANGTYYIIHLTSFETLLVHRIGRIPSFDQLILIKNHLKQSTISVKNRQPINVINQQTALSRVGVQVDKIIYTEIQDFQVRQ